MIFLLFARCCARKSSRAQGQGRFLPGEDMALPSHCECGSCQPPLQLRRSWAFLHHQLASCTPHFTGIKERARCLSPQQGCGFECGEILKSQALFFITQTLASLITGDLFLLRAWIPDYLVTMKNSLCSRCCSWPSVPQKICTHLAQPPKATAAHLVRAQATHRCLSQLSFSALTLGADAFHSVRA